MTSWPKVRAAVLARDVVCQDCGCDVGAWTKWECAHRVPRYQGGSDSLDNCRCLCTACHRKETSAEAGHRSAGRKTTVKTRHGQVVKRKRSKSKRVWPKREVPNNSTPWVRAIKAKIAAKEER